MANKPIVSAEFSPNVHVAGCARTDQEGWSNSINCVLVALLLHVTKHFTEPKMHTYAPMPRRWKWVVWAQCNRLASNTVRSTVVTGRRPSGANVLCSSFSPGCWCSQSTLLRLRWPLPPWAWIPSIFCTLARASHSHILEAHSAHNLKTHVYYATENPFATYNYVVGCKVRACSRLHSDTNPDGFYGKHLGKVNYFLGMAIDQYDDYSISVHQMKFITKMLDKFIPSHQTNSIKHHTMCAIMPAQHHN